MIIKCPICRAPIQVGLHGVAPWVIIHCQDQMDLAHNNFACWLIVQRRNDDLAREVMLG